MKIARAAGKVFCSCPACDCAGPFPSRPAKKIGLLLSLMPLAGFYLMRNEMLPVAIMWWKHRAVPETAVLSTHLLYALAFVAPFFVVLIVTRGAVKCPSCGYRFWFNKKGIEGNTVLSSL